MSRGVACVVLLLSPEVVLQIKSSLHFLSHIDLIVCTNHLYYAMGIAFDI